MFLFNSVLSFLLPFFFSPLVSASQVLHVSCSRVRTGNEDVRNSLGPKES